MQDSTGTPPWWRRGSVYQIYPRSFQDSNGDGIGDLPGALTRLDHCAWLGVDAVWLSPFFPSPMVDFGYDVADYCGVDPVFGTVEDAERLIARAHLLGLKVIFDLVPNHTSDQHPWFLASRASRDNPKRDWYLWRDPAPDGGPPNNWRSVFGGPGWELDPATGQYYYHAFLKEQPDLNWRNPEVRAAIWDAMRFWLERGVDGFRVDVIWHLIKDDQFRDNPENPKWQPGHGDYRRLIPLWNEDRPEVHEVVWEMRRVVDAYQDRVLIGEIYLPVERLVTYYGENLAGCHLPFNFHLILSPWAAEQIGALIARYEAALPAGAWPNWVLGNHDRHRIASRVGAAQARVAQLLLLTLRGTPTLYYGDELGMEDVPIPADRVQDPWELNEPGIGLGRDPERTPMAWEPGPNAGFTRGVPWLPLHADADTRNVEVQARDPDSMLSLTRDLLALRRGEPSLHSGDWRLVTAEGTLLAYLRSHGAHRVLVALNFGPTPVALPLPAGFEGGEIAVSTLTGRGGLTVWGTLALGGDEGVVVVPPH